MLHINRHFSILKNYLEWYNYVANLKDYADFTVFRNMIESLQESNTFSHWIFIPNLSVFPSTFFLFLR